MGDELLVARRLVQRLRDTPPAGPLLLLGTAAALRPLLRHDELLQAAPLLAASGSRRALRRLASLAPLLRCDGQQPPLQPRSLGALVPVEQLRGQSGLEDQARTWAKLLRPGGLLLVVQSLSLNAAVRALTRVRLTPDDLTRVLLNLGFTDIRQSWTREGSGILLTSGRLSTHA